MIDAEAIFRPLDNATARVTPMIRELIVKGALESGGRLKEVELAERLGVSRTPIREALLVLRAEGLVTIESRRGATIRTYGIAELKDMYDLRAVLEGYAARLAAERATEESVDQLRVSRDRFARLCADDDVDVSALVNENYVFHGGILKAGGSARLTEMVENVIQLPLVYKSYIWYSPRQKLLSDHYHQKLTDAIADRHGERSEILMKEHVYEARDHLLATMKTQAADKASRA